VLRNRQPALRDALAETGKVAVGQLILTGREHLIGIKPLARGLVLSILRYGHEVRPAESYLTASLQTHLRMR
jgi:DNA end-binding protein Ku